LEAVMIYDYVWRSDNRNQFILEDVAKSVEEY